MDKKKLVHTISAGAVAALLLTANLVGVLGLGGILDKATGALGEINFDSAEFKETTKQSSELVKLIGEEGIALLRNENNALPLKFEANAPKRINVFGWASTDAGFLLRGIGSGSTDINPEKTVTLLGALKNAGIEYNEEVIEMYEKYNKTNFEFGTGNSGRMKIIEPPQTEKYYSDELINNAIDFSDVAVVTISRVAGENVGEIPLNQPKTGADVKQDNSRHYLEISQEEEDLIKMCKERFSKTIVIINSSNQMQLNFLEDLDVDAAINVCLMGQNAAEAIPEILLGDVNPSGRLTDTYAYDYKAAPSFKNYVRKGDNIQYVEDLYFGYRYYETADADGVFDNESNDYGRGYDAVVQYPFGYGLSYTSFEWKLESTSLEEGKEFTKDGKIELNFSCTNTGKVAGKDVMQVYAAVPYSGEVEKSAIQLVNFEKTALIEPGKTQRDIIIEVDPYYFASFDAYDKNGNGHTTYELDAGDYFLKFMENSHEAKAMDGKTELKYTLKNEIVYDKDPVTGETVTTRLTGEDAFSGVALDGSNAFNNRTDYLSRETLAAGAKEMSTSLNSSNISKANNFRAPGFNQTEMPTLNADNGLYLKHTKNGSKATAEQLRVINNSNTEWDDELVEKIGTNYDCPELDQLIDQLSADDACYIVENCGFETPAMASIGKELTHDYDGPAGFNRNVSGINKSGWSAFPSETLVGQTWSKYIAKQFGLAMGAEGAASSVNGWYAPGCNLHRTPFNARNYEYYSEDPVLSGYMTASVVTGAKANGLYCYVKHFSLSEPGQNARNLNTWLTEQNYREVYLRPFEIAVKIGGANAMMSAFNSVGGVWAGANYAQNVDILRNEWGFRGMVLTDWSDGGGNMNAHQGVRGGNDIWLNPNTGSHASKLDRNDPTEVYCAKLAAKNVVYTICNTRLYAQNYDHSNDMMNVKIGTLQEVKGSFPWWRIVLYTVDGVAVVGLAIWMFLVWRLKKSQ